MKLTCSRNLLAEAISTVQRAVSVRSTNPVLDGILLKADQELVLTGYDSETGIEYRMEADISQKGSLVVPAKILSEVVRKLSDNQVYLAVKDETVLVVESGKSVFNIRGYAADQYPEIAFVEDETKIVLKQNTLRQMINQTGFAVSTDQSRPILMGINLIVEEETLTLVALDGFRLAVRREPIPGVEANINIIIPAKAMGEIARILTETDDEVVVSPSHNYIIFSRDKVKVVTRLIRGEFLNYRSIIPRDADTSMTIAPDILLAAVIRASIMIDTEDRKFPVIFNTPDHDTMTIESKTDIGTAREEIPVALSGDKVEIDFNPRFFIEALREIEDEQIVMTFSGSLGPCSLKPVKGDEFYYMILPLRR
ncbi:MAG: DNA polymerase III subunit beta [Clostridiaceae bacterium]|jgi:DNA polymerase-3 subunit beta|nr:DNA polymerase III subunit beta [Clostridiaceae bacterium]